MLGYDPAVIEPVGDGVADVDGYLMSPLKAMWILKEPWDDFDSAGMPTGGGWNSFEDDEARLMESVRHGRSFHKIVYASYALLNGIACYNDMPWIRDKPDVMIFAGTLQLYAGDMGLDLSRPLRAYKNGDKVVADVHRWNGRLVIWVNHPNAHEEQAVYVDSILTTSQIETYRCRIYPHYKAICRDAKVQAINAKRELSLFCTPWESKLPVAKESSMSYNW